MTPETFLDGRVKLFCGDCLDVLKTLPENSIDSVVTDPPYALVSITKRFGKEESAPCREGKTGAYARASRGFMGKKWDTGERAFTEELWSEVLRVLKPGGHVLAFGGTRTVHRLACAIEDAGFEIRDRIEFDHDSSDEYAAFAESLNDEQARQFQKLFLENSAGSLSYRYGTGFPKSHDVSKGIDKLLGAERGKIRVDAAQVRNPKATGAGRDGMEGATRPWIEAALERGYHEKDSEDPASPQAADWSGWGTALKPATEPIVVARKPLSEKSVAANVLRWGTGALNINGCRIPLAPGIDDSQLRAMSRSRREENTSGQAWGLSKNGGDEPQVVRPEGRWPANVIHDGSDEVLSAYPDAPGQQFYVGPEHGERPSKGIYGDFGARPENYPRGDTGSAGRYFYAAKADSDDRLGSSHPTVKRVDLIGYLIRLSTPPGGVTLDCFAGTGTAGEAAFREGMRAILIEREEEYQNDIRRRMALCMAGPDERARESAKAKNEGKPIDAGPLFGSAA